MIAPIKLRGVTGGVDDAVVGLVFSAATAFIDDPAKRHFAVQPKVGQQADYGPLVLLFRLLDGATGNELVEDLPHCHRMIGLEDGNDFRLDAVNFGPGSPIPLYWACLIKFGRVLSRMAAFPFWWVRLTTVLNQGQ